MDKSGEWGVKLKGEGVRVRKKGRIVRGEQSTRIVIPESKIRLKKEKKTRLDPKTMNGIRYRMHMSERDIEI